MAASQKDSNGVPSAVISSKSDGSCRSTGVFSFSVGQHKTSSSRQLRSTQRLIKPVSKSLHFSLRRCSKCKVPSSNKLAQTLLEDFAATGSENIRSDLGYYGCGSINWGALTAMAEKLHDKQLSELQEDPSLQEDWVGDPAWQEDFSGFAGNYARKLHYRMEWTYFGGQTVSHIPDHLWWTTIRD